MEFDGNIVYGWHHQNWKNGNYEEIQTLSQMRVCDEYHMNWSYQISDLRNTKI